VQLDVFVVNVGVKQIGSSLGAGLSFLPLTAVALVANLSASRLQPTLGPRRVILIGLAAMACGRTGLIVAARSTPFTDLVVQLVLLGAASGSSCRP
jgi:fucose permease